MGSRFSDIGAIVYRIHVSVIWMKLWSLVIINIIDKEYLRIKLSKKKKKDLNRDYICLQVGTM